MKTIDAVTREVQDALEHEAGSNWPPKSVVLDEPRGVKRGAPLEEDFDDIERFHSTKCIKMVHQDYERLYDLYDAKLQSSNSEHRDRVAQLEREHQETLSQANQRHQELLSQKEQHEVAVSGAEERHQMLLSQKADEVRRECKSDYDAYRAQTEGEIAQLLHQLEAEKQRRCAAEQKIDLLESEHHVAVANLQQEHNDALARKGNEMRDLYHRQEKAEIDLLEEENASALASLEKCKALLLQQDDEIRQMRYDQEHAQHLLEPEYYEAHDSPQEQNNASLMDEVAPKQVPTPPAPNKPQKSHKHARKSADDGLKRSNRAGISKNPPKRQPLKNKKQQAAISESMAKGDANIRSAATPSSTLSKNGSFENDDKAREMSAAQRDEEFARIERTARNDDVDLIEDGDYQQGDLIWNGKYTKVAFVVRDSQQPVEVLFAGTNDISSMSDVRSLPFDLEEKFKKNNNPAGFLKLCIMAKCRLLQFDAAREFLEDRDLSHFHKRLREDGNTEMEMEDITATEEAFGANWDVVKAALLRMPDFRKACEYYANWAFCRGKACWPPTFSFPEIQAECVKHGRKMSEALPDDMVRRMDALVSIRVADATELIEAWTI